MLKQEVELESKLKEIFGYNTFRSRQKEIIQAVLSQKDVLAILPTGAGKSLCYQLPAMLLDGVAVVVSPLISLMQDQVVSLFKNGIPAAFLNSSLYYQDIQNVLDHLSDYKLLYIAPERFSDQAFLQRLKEVQVSFFVIDEAHCISQWGHSFRSEYRKLSLLKEHFPSQPIMALTATATQDVEEDISRQLTMENPEIIKSSFDRPNLTIRINQKIYPEKQLLEFLSTQQDKSGIVYAATRKTVDATYQQLKDAGYSVNRYHAGMTDQERMSSQNEFLHDQVQLMVATVAFGMGIHKPDVRFIVHLDMPRSIEQYYQEIGRAGRDGLPAECLMLYGAQDIIVYKTFLDELEDPVIRKQTKIKTEKMYRLCTSSKCRRIELLNYFNEEYASKCMACDNCIDDTNLIDGTIIAQKILSCVFRLKQNFGIRTVIDVLRGSKNQMVLERKFDQLSTYGLLAELPEKEVRYYIESLVHMDILTLTEGDYPVLKWTENSRAVIDQEKEIFFKKKIFKEAKAIKENVNITLHYDEQVFSSLRQLRLEIAQEEKVPPYVVFSDRALQEMAVYFPKTQQEFDKINGVGPIKWLKYGERFLAKIQELVPNRPAPVVEKAATSAIQRKQSSEETIRLFKEGYSLEQIIETRQLARSTILTHLDEKIQQGDDLDISRIVDLDKQQAIKQVISMVGHEKLTPIKQQLPETFTYDEIRLVIAFYRRQN